MYFALALLLLALMTAGTILTLWVFNFRWAALKEVDLDKKIMLWVPFGLLFLLILYLGPVARSITLAIIIAMMIIEFSRVIERQTQKIHLTGYLMFLIVCLLHLVLLRFVYPDNTVLIIYILIGTVVSDVGGFMFGKFFGAHKLPDSFNKNKSWEGVLGQIVGALIGVVLVEYFVIHDGTFWLFLPIGLGSAIGDLLNSHAKRVAGIKNWSNFIPGHGGFIDRFCSLSVSSAFTFYFILFVFN